MEVSRGRAEMAVTEPLLQAIEVHPRFRQMRGVGMTPVWCSPQGAVISPLLANLCLHELDAELREARLVMVRYADDDVLLCRSREEAHSALARLRAWVIANGLRLNPEKTHVGDCRADVQGSSFWASGSKPGSVGCARKVPRPCGIRSAPRPSVTTGTRSAKRVRLSTRLCAAGMATSSMLTGSRFLRSTALFAVG